MCLLFLFVVLPYASLDGDGMLPILLSGPLMSLSVALHPTLLHMAVGVSFALSVVLWVSFRLLFLLLFIPSAGCRLSVLFKNYCILSRLHNNNYLLGYAAR